MPDVRGTGFQVRLRRRESISRSIQGFQKSASSEFIESHKAPMLLASIEPDCFLESRAAALHTKEVDELTWDYVATTFIDEYTPGEAPHPKRGGRKGKKKINRNKRKDPRADHKSDSNDSTDTESTTQVIEAALKSARLGDTVQSVSGKCNCCEKKEHIEDKCYLNRDNPDYRLPRKLLAQIKSKGKKPKFRCNSKSRKIEIAAATVETA